MKIGSLFKKFTGVIMSGLLLANISASVMNAGYTPQMNVSAADTAMRDITTMELVRDMGIGINLGNTFDACGDWIAEWSDGSTQAYETAWGSPVITKKIIQGYADEGFGVLRIPTAWSNMMVDDGSYTINEEWMQRITEVVDWTLESGMYAIVNIHWDNGWVNKFPDNKDECMKRFEKMWVQISDNFKDYGDHLMFEAQNEELGWDTVWNKWQGDNGKVESYQLVNEINQKFVDTIRSSGGNNPKRHLLISGYNTGIDVTCDPLFKMPNDPANRMAVSVHYYSPAGFAILEEDADWGKAVSTWGTNAEYNELYSNLDMMKNSFIDKGIPVIIGEYGCPIKNKEPESVRRFLSAVCEAAYTRQLCPVLWDTPGGHYDREGSCQLNDRQLHDNFIKIVGERPRPIEEGFFHSTFEEDTDKWTARGSAEINTVSNASFEGNKSLSVTGRTDSWNGASRSLSSTFSAGKKYSFSVNVMHDDTDENVTYFMKLQYTGSDGETHYDGIASGVAPKGEWLQLANTNYKIPEGASDMVIYIETDGTKNSFYIDEAISAEGGTKIEGAGQPDIIDVILGDTDSDGKITAFDMILARKAVLGETDDKAVLKAADVDGNGKVEINDIVLLQKYILGEITVFSEK